MGFITITLLVLFIGQVLTIPVVKKENANLNIDSDSSNNIGEASQVIAKSLLNSNIESNVNYVFSPLGYASILAILSEGAEGETKSEIDSILGHPTDGSKMRSEYHKVLESLQGIDPSNAPQLKTWFYIYKNNTANEDYKKILKEDYFVEVRTIAKHQYDWDELDKVTTSTTERLDVPDLKSLKNDKDIEGFEDLKEQIPFNPEDETRIDPQLDSNKFDEVVEEEPEKLNEDSKLKTGLDISENSNEKDLKSTGDIKEVKNEDTSAVNPKQNDKDIPTFNTLKQSVPVDPQDELRIDPQLDDTKFDEVVEEKQYVDVPVIKEQILKQNKLKEIHQKHTKLHEEKNEKVRQSISDETIKRKFKELKSRSFRTIFNNGDVASALSGNSIVRSGRNENESRESKMLLFNGLYYRGAWSTPFQQLRSEMPDLFYTSDSEKLPVIMMRAKGQFRYANLSDLSSEAIEFPYKNERYSMLVIVPNGKNEADLVQLVRGLNRNFLSEINNQMEELNVEVSLPKFRIETTSQAKESLIKDGIKSLFSDSANLNKITKEQKLQVDELVQHVAFRADEGSSSENFLTATSALRSNIKFDKVMSIDRSFLFFVYDNQEQMILIAGKHTIPEVRVEQELGY